MEARAGPRPKDRVLIESTGDNPGLADIELSSLSQFLQGGGPVDRIAPAVTLMPVPRGGAEEVARRIGLARHVGTVLAEADRPEGFEAPALTVKGTFAVRATVLEGAPEGTRSGDVERAVGKMFKGGRVDLVAPQHVFRVYVGERAYLTHEVYDRGNDDFEERAVKHRPYFMPVSLHPKFARALVNATQVHDGEFLLDPFCGTGGILMEAALVGARPVGIDADLEAVEGTRKNLEHFGVLGAPVHHGLARDARALVGHEVAGVAFDPPYGRSSSTMKKGALEAVAESVDGIVEVLRPRGFLAMCAPDIETVRLFDQHFDQDILARQRVHASLTRYYAVLRKRK